LGAVWERLTINPALSASQVRLLDRVAGTYRYHPAGTKRARRLSHVEKDMFVKGTMSVAGECSVEIIDNIDDLERVRPMWDDLQWYPYSDLDYYIRSFELEDTFLSPYVIVLSRNGQPETLAIGRILSKRMNWRIGYKSIYRPRLRALEFVHSGLLGDLSPDNCETLVTAIRDSLRQKVADISYVDFVATDSAFCSAIEDQVPFALKDHFPTKGPHHKAALPDNYPDFLARLSKNSRQNARRYPAALEREYEGRLRIECYDQPGQVDQALEDIEVVADKTYQRAMSVGFKNDDDTRQKWEYTTKLGWLKAYVLYLDQKPAAFWNGFRYRNMFLISTTGFDPELAKSKPGNYLLLKIIEQYCSDEDCELIDFGMGDARYKSIYGTECVEESKFFIFPATAKGLRLNTVHSMTKLSASAALKVVERFGSADKLKKIWRNRLQRS